MPVVAATSLRPASLSRSSSAPGFRAHWSHGRDSGAEAEPANSGGQFYFLSPGVSFSITKSMQIYPFYQRALYRYVNRIQLTANWSAVAGITARF
jgi:hypothetical protein